MTAKFLLGLEKCHTLTLLVPVVHPALLPVHVSLPDVWVVSARYLANRTKSHHTVCRFMYRHFNHARSNQSFNGSFNKLFPDVWTMLHPPLSFDVDASPARPPIVKSAIWSSKRMQCPQSAIDILWCSFLLWCIYLWSTIYIFLSFWSKSLVPEVFFDIVSWLQKPPFIPAAYVSSSCQFTLVRSDQNQFTMRLSTLV